MLSVWSIASKVKVKFIRINKTARIDDWMTNRRWESRSGRFSDGFCLSTFLIEWDLVRSNGLGVALSMSLSLSSGRGRVVGDALELLLSDSNVWTLVNSSSLLLLSAGERLWAIWYASICCHVNHFNSKAHTNEINFLKFNFSINCNCTTKWK